MSKRLKGIILAGGTGSRLYPITKAVSKQLLPVYDKPLVYYPLSTLMLLNIRDILLITNQENLKLFEKLLGDGSELGLRISYKVQDHPKGIAEAFIIGDEFIGEDDCCLILGDNIFYGDGLVELFDKIGKEKIEGGRIFGYHVSNPQDFGVVEFDQQQKVVSIEEKPKKPKSSYAIPGLYFYDNHVVEIARKVSPSKRGELEITDIHRSYLEKGQLQFNLLKRGIAWFDAGTPDGLLEASSFIKVIQNRLGQMIACPEEIAYQKGYISKVIGADYNEYTKYLLNIGF